MSEVSRITGTEVIAAENQGLWEAIVEPGTIDPDLRVALYMEDRSVQGGAVVVEHHRIDGSIALAEFVMRLLVQNAVDYEANPCCRAKSNPQQLADYLLVPSLILEPGYASFPALVAGVGWFGTISLGGELTVTMSCDPVEVIALGIGENWLRYGPAGSPAPPNPNPNIWSRRTGEIWYGWIPIRADGQPDESRPSPGRHETRSSPANVDDLPRL